MCFMGCVSVHRFVVPEEGQVLFATEFDARNAVLVDPVTSAQRDDVIGMMGVFPRDVSGELILRARDQQGHLFVGHQSLVGPANTWGAQFDLHQLPNPGDFTFELSVDGDLLASGSLEVSP
jgi:hypothetical protein